MYHLMGNNNDRQKDRQTRHIYEKPNLSTVIMYVVFRKTIGRRGLERKKTLHTRHLHEQFDPFASQLITQETKFEPMLLIFAIDCFRPGS